jgi:formate dehydrogenase maturation protein FdhE
MKLYCHNCDSEQDIYVELKGPHLKATCAKCHKYIKFLSKEEKKQLEDEEDKLAEAALREAARPAEGKQGEDK